MTISTNLERLTYGGPSGCIAPGLHHQVIQSVGATRTLVAEESGSLCLFDTAAGNIYTLPAPVEGMYFDFVVNVDGTSNAYKVITNSASVFLTGGVMISSLTVAESGDVFLANGTSHVSLVADGDTKGRLKGAGRVRFTCISSTLWFVEGFLTGAGTLADPFV
jgi:hypothetical protein